MKKRRDFDRELREEMQFHLDMRAAEYERNGLSPRDSAAAAHKQFGSTSIVHEDASECTSARWLRWSRQSAANCALPFGA